MVEQKWAETKSVKIHYSTKDYTEIFPEVIETASRSEIACFIFIDQFGFNAVDAEKFKQLAACGHTDILFFVASSVARRFVEHENNKAPLEHRGRWVDAHRDMAEAYRRHVTESEYYVVPFSIKKNGNIYGLIFGSRHPLGAEKFIHACWGEDVNAGEANFSVDGDYRRPSNMISMIPPKKIKVFGEHLEEGILSGAITTNLEAYLFALHSGVKSAHAREILRRMERESKISKAPVLSYSSVIKNKRVVKIEPKR